MITKDDSWEDALKELSALPGDLQKQHGPINFLHAGRFRRNARALYDHCLAPVLERGVSLEVVCGFVDARFASLLPEPLLPGATEFLAARVRVVETGETLDLSLHVGGA